jgi:hypothetical protein
MSYFLAIFLHHLLTKNLHEKGNKMKIDIVNIDHLVEVNKLPRITNPIYLEREQVPT